MSDQVLSIRKIYTIFEEIHSEYREKLVDPKRKVAAIAVFKNPFAGIYQEDLSLLYDYGEELGGLLGELVVKSMGIKIDEAKEKVDSYGKGVIVGFEGEIEHGHAIIHPKFGGSCRKVLGGRDYCKAIMPSTAKIGAIGEKIDVPLHYKVSEWVVTHYDTMEVCVPDGPRPDEILVVLAISDAGRPLPRTKGLQKHEITP